VVDIRYNVVRVDPDGNVRKDPQHPLDKKSWTGSAQDDATDPIIWDGERSLDLFAVEAVMLAMQAGDTELKTKLGGNRALLFERKRVLDEAMLVPRHVFGGSTLNAQD